MYRFLADRFVEGTCPLCAYEVREPRSIAGWLAQRIHTLLVGFEFRACANSDSFFVQTNLQSFACDLCLNCGLCTHAGRQRRPVRQVWEAHQCHRPQGMYLLGSVRYHVQPCVLPVQFCFVLFRGGGGGSLQ